MSRNLDRMPLGETGQRTRRLHGSIGEPLEDRALMSALNLLSFLTPAGPAAKPVLSPAVVSSELPRNVSGRIAGLYELSLSNHPPYQSVVGSRVLKAPMFNLAYTGPKFADLDVVGADATIDSRPDIEFTGQVLGPINVSETGLYSFLIDRGGASSPGPIKGQPGIRFDAVVQVSTGSGATTATVSLLNSQEQPISTTSLPASSFQIVGDTVKVTVPLDLLPSTAPPSVRPKAHRDSYTFTTSLPGDSESDVAGFATAYTMISVDASGLRRH
jgi:hypothetical protein